MKANEISGRQIGWLPKAPDSASVFIVENCDKPNNNNTPIVASIGAAQFATIFQHLFTQVGPKETSKKGLALPGFFLFMKNNKEVNQNGQLGGFN